MSDISPGGVFFNAPGSEIIIGLIGAVGTDLVRVEEILNAELAHFSYESSTIRVIEAVHQFDDIKQQLRDLPVDVRYQTHMDAGNNLRKRLERKDAFALLSVANIRVERSKLTGDEQKAAHKQAYILRSLKTPEEIQTLREVYGKSFFCLSVFSHKDHRLSRLASLIADSHNSTHTHEFQGKAMDLIQRDQSENEDYGQNVRLSFPLGDFFVNGSEPSKLQPSLARIVEAYFGHPFHTPTRDEYGMFHSYAASMRSASLGRQVGAAVTTQAGELIAASCNEVPKAGGGSYWAGDSPDERDHNRGEDSNDKMKRKLFADVLQRLQTQKWLDPGRLQSPLQSLVDEALRPPDKGGLGKVELMNIIEYGRSVHAEMAALLQAARLGTRVKDCTLYTTTFPCHNCSKHIIEAGITRVVYIEPYPKSLAAELHSDAIEIDERGHLQNPVNFESFVGIAPRMFLELFSAAGIERKTNGKPAQFNKSECKPRLRESSWAYLRNELAVINFLKIHIEQKQLTTVKESKESK
jgi:deoxycytidylate deaminase